VRDAIDHWIRPETLRITKVAEESEREVLERIAGEYQDPGLDPHRPWTPPKEDE
jgi:hypothetical protein